MRAHAAGRARNSCAGANLPGRRAPGRAWTGRGPTVDGMEAVTTPVVALLGFAVVAVSGGVLRARGRRAAGIMLACTAAACVVVLLIAVGRDAVGQFVVGGSAALPVLVAFAWAASRDARDLRDEA